MNAADRGKFFITRSTHGLFADDGCHAPPATFPVFVTGKIDDHLFYRLDSTLRGLAEARQQGLDCGLVVAGWVAKAPLARARALADELGLSDVVAFSGPYTQEEAPAVYRRADAYVMTKHNDPCPNTVLEALACGLPVLYSDSGGVPNWWDRAASGCPARKAGTRRKCQGRRRSAPACLLSPPTAPGWRRRHGPAPSSVSTSGNGCGATKEVFVQLIGDRS